LNNLLLELDDLIKRDDITIRKTKKKKRQRSIYRLNIFKHVPNYNEAENKSSTSAKSDYATRESSKQMSTMINPDKTKVARPKLNVSYKTRMTNIVLNTALCADGDNVDIKIIPTKTENNSMQNSNPSLIKASSDITISTAYYYSKYNVTSEPGYIKLIEIRNNFNFEQLEAKMNEIFSMHNAEIVDYSFRFFEDLVNENEPSPSKDYYTITANGVYVLKCQSCVTYHPVIEIVNKPGSTAFVFLYEKEAEKYIDVIYEEFKKLHVSDESKDESNKFYVVSQTQYGFDLEEFDTSKFQSTFDPNNYNDSCVKANARVTDYIINGNKGLVLLHGEPGTGKTTYIKSIISMEKKRKVVLIPPHMTSALSSPSFITFVRNSLANHVLIIEDAETVLRARDSGQSDVSAVANILNISDGIIGDALNILIICTFNTDIDNIDPALLRKGRLLLEYKFDALEYDKKVSLLTKIHGISEHEASDLANSKMTLADIYNLEIENKLSTSFIEKKKTFGFTN
jgi:hypothetical protein